MIHVGCVALGRRPPAELDRRLEAARAASHSYAHVGSTLGDAVPAGVPDVVIARDVDGSLPAAAAALRAWAAHAGIHGRPYPADAPLEVGASLLVVVPFGPVELAVPNRIVVVVSEPGRFGFAYGTLEGHDEAGEELFLAEEIGPGRLRLQCRIHARAGSRPARLVAPLVRRISHAAAGRYLTAWEHAIAPPP